MNVKNIYIYIYIYVKNVKNIYNIYVKNIYIYIF